MLDILSGPVHPIDCYLLGMKWEGNPPLSSPFSLSAYYFFYFFIHLSILALHISAAMTIDMIVTAAALSHVSQSGMFRYACFTSIFAVTEPFPGYCTLVTTSPTETYLSEANSFANRQ